MLQARQIETRNRMAVKQQQVHYPVPGTVSANRPKKFKLVLIFSVCFLLCLVVVAQYSALVILNYQISNARVDLAEVESQLRILELEASQLNSLNRIETIARQELGMVEPQIGQLRILSNSLGEDSPGGE